MSGTKGRWDGRSRLPVAILVDVDGTLAGMYRGDERDLRPGASEALARLARVAPVFLWSAAGSDNGRRLLAEYPALKRHVTGCWHKEEFPLDLVDAPYAIDDDGVDEPVLLCRHVILDETWFGGEDDGLFARAVEIVLAAIEGVPQQSAAHRDEGGD